MFPARDDCFEVGDNAEWFPDCGGGVSCHAAEFELFPAGCKGCRCDGPVWGGEEITPVLSLTESVGLGAPQVRARIERAKHPQGLSFLSEGLEHVLAVEFGPGGDARRDDPDVTQVLVVITDGQATVGHEPGKLLDPLRRRHRLPTGGSKFPGVLTYAVGVGKEEEPCVLQAGGQLDPDCKGGVGINPEQLERIAGARSRYFNPQSFDELESWVDRLEHRLCTDCTVTQIGASTAVAVEGGLRVCFKPECAAAGAGSGDPLLIEVRMEAGSAGPVLVYIGPEDAGEPGRLSHTELLEPDQSGAAVSARVEGPVQISVYGLVPSHSIRQTALSSGWGARASGGAAWGSERLDSIWPFDASRYRTRNRGLTCVLRVQVGTRNQPRNAYGSVRRPRFFAEASGRRHPECVDARGALARAKVGRARGGRSERLSALPRSRT